MNNAFVSQVGFNRPKLTLSMRVFGPRNSAYFLTYIYDLLEKWFPFQGERAHSLFFCIHVNRKEEGETEQQQTYQFTKGCNIFHRLQVHHLTLTFIIHNKYISTLYLYTYIHIYVIGPGKTGHLAQKMKM